jgi:hypothetical protein
MAAQVWVCSGFGTGEAGRVSVCAAPVLMRWRRDREKIKKSSSIYMEGRGGCGGRFLRDFPIRDRMKVLLPPRRRSAIIPAEQ